MLLFPFLFLRTIYYLERRYVGVLSFNFSAGDSVFIKSSRPLLSVLFHGISGLKADIFIEKDHIGEYTDLRHIYGFDFGAAIGGVLFIAEKPIENFLVSAIIYPTSCLERRFLSTRPMHNLTFSLHPKIGEYQIWDHQEICFWHAIGPNNRTIIINYDTEEMFDVIRVYTSGKRSVELSGIGTKYYKTDTPIFFHWSSDHLNLSNYFSIYSAGTNLYPPFFTELTVNKTTAITVFSSPDTVEITSEVVNMSDVPFIQKDEGISWQSFMPYIFAITLALIISSIFSVIWCYKYKKSFISPDVNNIRPTSDYDYASGKGEMPLPIIQTPLHEEEASVHV